MSIEGIFLMGSILSIFAIFAATLAWSAHQTRLADRSRTQKANVVGFQAKDTAIQSRAA